MPLKYPLVQALVIVIADLYLPEEGFTGALVVPGLERIARFGRRTVLADGWRPWLARCVGAAALVEEAPASVAARCCEAALADGVWLATPVHCIAGLSSVHLEHRGLLKLSLPTLRALAADFHQVFQGSGFTLVPLASGGFLLSGPAVPDPQALEPARCVGVPVEAGLPRSPALRRLGAEIEIWLHEHAVNRARSERGALPVTSLWLWGGGTMRPAAPPPAPAAHARIAADRAYGRDPYLEGLWCARGARLHSLPARLADLAPEPAGCTVIVLELSELIHAERASSAHAALAALDALWLAPAARLVARGALNSLAVVVNDRCLVLRQHDRLKLWRRARRGLAGIA
jgi:hypothetical protein